MTNDPDVCHPWQMPVRGLAWILWRRSLVGALSCLIRDRKRVDAVLRRLP